VGVSDTTGAAVPAAELTVSRLLLDRLGDDRPAIRFEGRSWTWDQHVHESADRATVLSRLRRPGPFHVGVLLDNVPDFSFLLGAAALNDAVVVGINPTRRGAELARDVTATDCQLIVTDERYRALLDGLELGFGPDRVLAIDGSEWAAHLGPARSSPVPVDRTVDESQLLMLIFTSGTSGEPKAVRVTHRKIAGPGTTMVRRGSVGRADVVYVSMPMFHSACVFQAWASALAAGATMVMRRRFSASGFLPDVRQHGVTFFHYVGKPLAYILATPERPDDADTTLVLAAGNEAAPLDIDRFATRFGCRVEDGFGSTEGGVYVLRTPDTPQGSIGVTPEGVQILDLATDRPVPPGRFDDSGCLLNPDEAIGELVNTGGAGAFEGYYASDEANAERMRGGMYHSGDLAYRDDRGFVYFAGRTIDWLRVDGENFGAAPVERILARDPSVSQVAVYAVPDVDTGDRVMAALKLHDGRRFDPDAFAAFLATQPDLGTKWAPTYVRVVADLPSTQTNKVLKRMLGREGWECADAVWVRRQRSDEYRPLTDDDRAELRRLFASQGREHLLAAPSPPSPISQRRQTT
jgi:fatty-acyl-CoA synthase